jgi:Kef-type K+ transport system membrane component KefB
LHGDAILFISLLIIVGKLASIICNRIQLPPVIGMIVFGFILGPTCLDCIDLHASEHHHIITLFADIGVIMLLFMAGLETNLTRLAQSSKTGLLTALGGMLLPFTLGFTITMLFTRTANPSLIMGVILTATSVSVTVITLMEMKKLQTPEGTSIITAAILDDILGIVLLTFILGLIGSENRPVWQNLCVILVYLGASILFGLYLLPVLLNLIAKYQVRHGVLALAISLLFIFAWSAERSGIAAITGAFILGVFTGKTRYRDLVNEGMDTIGQSIFISIFFLSIGLGIDLKSGHFNWGYVILFSLAAMLGKILGSGLGAKISGFSWRRSLRIGTGMMPRGEVALVIASIAMDPGHGAILKQSDFTAVVCVVLLTGISTPVLLKIAFTEPKTIKGG